MFPPAKSHFNLTSASTIYVYCDGACMSSSNGPVAGYGVYTNSDIYKVSICEPLPVGQQTSQRAKMRGFWSALELVWALRPRHAAITSNSDWIPKGYNHWMTMKSNGWKKENETIDAQADFWSSVDRYLKRMQSRGIDVEVIWKGRNLEQGQVMANALAKQACELNCLCRSCGRFVGREGTSHDCRFICRKDECDSKVFADLMAYRQHVEHFHGKKIKCRRYDCNMVFGSKMAAESHEDMIHEGYVFDCDYCNALYRSEEDKDDHEKDKCGHAPYCRDCDFWFGSVGARNQHWADYHGWCI